MGIDSLLQLDREFFSLLNSFHNSFFDWVMYVVSHKYTWIPLYVFFIYSIIKLTRKKLMVLAAVIIMVVITDVCASQVAKPTFKRLRPCHDTTIEKVHTVNNHCGKQYGFFSSHASNIFGLATFFFLFFKLKKGKTPLLWLLYGWAVVVGYSRIYLGVHFPLDVLTGFVCGYGVAVTTFNLLQKIKAI